MIILKISSLKTDDILKTLVKLLKKGGVLICPTDTVYGLLCDATNKKVVERIFKIKKREKTKPLGIFVKDIKTAKRYAFINKKQEKVLKEKWPGKFTFILKKKPNCGLSLLVGDKETVGIRIPYYKLVIEILEKIKKPIVQTSANISGQPPTTRIGEVLQQFRHRGNQPDLIINDGNLKKSKPSKVIDLINNNILRL